MDVAQTDSLSDIPNDIVLHLILQYLQCDDIAITSSLSSHFRTLVNHYVVAINPKLGIPIALNNRPFLSALGDFMSSASGDVVGVHHHVFDIKLTNKIVHESSSIKSIRSFIKSHNLNISTVGRGRTKESIVNDIHSECKLPVAVDLNAVRSLFEEQSEEEYVAKGGQHGDGAVLFCSHLELLENEQNKEHGLTVRMILGYARKGNYGLGQKTVIKKHRGRKTIGLSEPDPKGPSWPLSKCFRDELQS